MKRLGIVLGLVIFLSVFNTGVFAKVQEESSVTCPKEYIKVAPTEKRIWDALDTMKGTVGDFSRGAILGENLSGKPIRVEFLNLSTINPNYADYDALGIKKGKQLYIYVNQKHYDAPREALAALLSHEALHQDEYNSLNEETYAWTMEAKVWYDLVARHPEVKNKAYSSLVLRENILSKMLQNANFTNSLIKNTVVTHPGYQKLPMRSPGFE